LPKSPAGKAVHYTLTLWPRLARSLEEGRFQIDNNLIENNIRSMAIGRKNYLFAGSHLAAGRIAMAYTFMASCKLNNVNPVEWLPDVLQRIEETMPSR
jgi:transposase